MLTRMIVAIVFLLSFLLGISQSPEEQFKAANEAYDNQQYDTCLQMYQAIENQGLSSAELYQNMGTAAYKLDLIPESVYYFEKGLKLTPGSADLQHNLKLANEEVIDKPSETASGGIKNWISSSVGGTADSWAIFSVIAALAGGICLVVYLFITQKSLKRLGLTTGILSWLFGVLFFIIAYIQYEVSNNQDCAVVFEPSVEVRNDPSSVASIAFVLHEGSKLKILDANENWYKVSFGEGKVGWLPKDSLKLI